MVNHSVSPYSERINPHPSQGAIAWQEQLKTAKNWHIFAAASFLVTVPVFIQAPLVRLYPELSLILTLGWLALSWKLSQHQTTAVWGDLLLGFTWSWLAGTIYWGWMRWEPLWHLPIEAIALPYVLYRLWRLRHVPPIASGLGKIGDFFYLGSLLGTVLTDVYFYGTDLIGHWRQLMQVDSSLALPIFQSAIARVNTPWGLSCAAVLAILLFTAGSIPLKNQGCHWRAFSGAVLSTILVDGLFWLAASAVR